MATFCCTNLVLAVTLSLMLEFAAADLQNIQNANPLNIDLSDPSQTQPTTNDNTDADDPKFGGYRPLYPPYFLRESTNVGEQQPNDQTYYDKEYYTRGTRHDERLDRNLRVPQQQMYLKYLILLAALLAVAYAAIEPLDLVAEESQEHSSGQHVRQKRFLLLKKAILAKKALAIGGAVGLGVGLVKAKHFGGGFGGGHGGGWQKPIVVHAYPVSHSSGWSSGGGWPSGGGGGGGGWSSASSSAWAGSSSW